MADAAETSGGESAVGGGGTSSSGVSVGSVSSSAIVITAPAEHPRIRITKWRVREGFPVTMSQVILLYELVGVDGGADKTVHKLKASRVGVVKKRLFKDGAIVERSAAILELSECVHTTVIKDMCADCGADLRQNENGNTSEASVPMVHSIPDLKVTQKLAQKLGHDDTRRLLADRKLVLLVDLDQTVIHTTNDNVPNNIKSIYHFQLYGSHSPWYHTRLRPGTPSFLEHMSQYYELHICTFGARNYAHMIAQLLDPEGKFFSHRILSRDECFNATSKTDNLKALFPNGDSMVCIIDDREDVWNMASNLIQVKPYHFFQHTGDINAPPGLSKHELDGEGVDFKDLNNLTTDKEKPEKAANKEKSTASEGTNDDKSLETPADDTTSKKENNVEEVDTASTTVEIAATEKTAAVEVNPEETAPPAVSEKAVTNATNPVEAAQEKKNDAVQEEQETTPEKEKVAQTQVTSTTEVNEKAVKAIPKAAVEPEAASVEAQHKEAKADDADDAAETLPAVPSTTNAVAAAAAVILPKIKLPTDPQQQIEIDDPDDYLLYLEVILKTIHARFYSIYDKTQEIPDLKIIVPKIRSEVLRDASLVFSGLVPTNMKLEQSRAYFIAKSLGANVSQNIGPDATHLVAVTSGTFKVNAAKKNPQLKVVNANWLWSCAERWERVDERLFPLDRKTKSKQRQPPAHCHSPEHVVNYSDKSEISSSSSAQQQNASEPEKFIDTINPLLSFSNADLADMNKEFDQFFESDSSSEDEHINIENPPVDKKLRKRKREEKEEERTRDFFTRSGGDIMIGAAAAGAAAADESDKSSNEKGEEDNNDDGEEEEDDDDEVPSTKFRRGEKLPSDLEINSEDTNDSDNNNPDTEDDGDWNMMGAALEREFLGLED